MIWSLGYGIISSNMADTVWWGEGRVGWKDVLALGSNDSSSYGIIQLRLANL